MLEATFFGVVLLGRDRVPPWFYFLSCCMVSLGTMFSSFWILANTSWMQVPLGHTIVDGRIIPADWWAITTGPIMRVRWPHMLLAAFLTTGMCVAATGAWYLLRDKDVPESRTMLRWGLGLVAVMIPVQMVFGHFTGIYVLNYQPAKFAAIEARWKTQQPASEVLIALPDETRELNLFAIEIPRLGGFIASGSWTAREIWLETFPPEDRPPVLIPLFGFRIMVGMGPIMLAISWFGCFLRFRARLETTRWFLWGRPSPSRAASSPSSPAGSPLRWGASRGSCTGCCARVRRSRLRSRPTTCWSPSPATFWSTRDSSPSACTTSTSFCGRARQPRRRPSRELQAADRWRLLTRPKDKWHGAKRSGFVLGSCMRCIAPANAIR